MNPVYKHVSENGQFIAFWRKSDTQMSLLSNNFNNNDITNINISYKATSETDDLEILICAVENYYNSQLGFYRYKFERNQVKLSTIEMGCFYPRIWRGCGNVGLGYNPIPPNEYGQTFHQADVATCSLFEKMFDIFQYIEPSKINLYTYGHRTRELLILASTEIEASFRSILKSNSSLLRTRDRFTTNDFFKLNEALRLSEWSVSSRYFHEVEILSPFASWVKDDPTKSLPWYNAYNAVKHDRESSFHMATLENLMNAMAALHIVSIAQWGPDIYGLFHQEKSPFLLESVPDFTSEIYIPDEQGQFRPIPYFDEPPCP